jgi:nucleoside-diphosphate-sugar epimerase
VKPHTTWYGINKCTAEQYCEFACVKHGIPYVVFRAGYLYDKTIVRGPIADIKSRGNLYKYNHPDSVFDFLHIEDLYRAMAPVIQNDFHRSGIYNKSSGIGISMRSIGDAAGRSRGFLNIAADSGPGILQPSVEKMLQFTARCYSK